MWEGQRISWPTWGVFLVGSSSLACRLCGRMTVALCSLFLHLAVSQLDCTPDLTAHGKDSKDQAHWHLSRVIPQMHLCVCALQCKEFTVVASWMHQISSNFENRLIFFSDGMHASVWKARWWCGDGRCDVASSQSFSFNMGILPSELLWQNPSVSLLSASSASFMCRTTGMPCTWILAPGPTLGAGHLGQVSACQPCPCHCYWSTAGASPQELSGSALTHSFLLLISASALWQECCKAAVEPSFNSILFGELTSIVCKVVVFGLWYVVFAFVCLFLCGFSFLFPLRLCSCCTAQSSFSSGLCYMNLGLVVGAVLFLSVPHNYSAQHCLASHLWVDGKACHRFIRSIGASSKPNQRPNSPHTRRKTLLVLNS